MGAAPVAIISLSTCFGSSTCAFISTSIINYFFAEEIYESVYFFIHAVLRSRENLQGFGVGASTYARRAYVLCGSRGNPESRLWRTCTRIASQYVGAEARTRRVSVWRTVRFRKDGIVTNPVLMYQACI